MWQCTGFMLKTAWKEKEKKVIVLCILQALFAVMGSLIGIYFSPAVLSLIESHASASALLLTIFFFYALIIGHAAFSAYVNYNALYGRITVRTAIITALSRKSCTTSYVNLGDEKYRKLRSKAGLATSSNSQATEAVWGTLTGLLQNILGFLFYLFLLFAVDFRLVAVVLVLSVTGYLINKQLSGYGYRHREEEGELAQTLWYNIVQAQDSGKAKDIRIFFMKPWIDEINQKTMAAFRAFHGRAQNVYIWGRIADLILAFLRNGIAYAYLIYLVLFQGLSVSDFLLYFSAVGGFTVWVSGILGGFSALYQQSLDLSTVMEVLDYPEPFLLEGGEKIEVRKDHAYEIRLEHVSFRYPGAENYALRDIDLTLRPGEKLAVVGLNGAGKTTLVKLICGFLDPTEGRVLLNGKDIREYNRREYYKIFSAVFQDFSLLAASVAVNVAQTEENIDMDRVKDCVEKAGLTEKILSMKNGFDALLNRTVYEEAEALSGGETQRLMLARALYKDAPVLILDEPTAALDPIAEENIYQKYNEMAYGRSSVYISHRLASTRFCDRILYIDDHVIAEEGTHETLMEKKGGYAALFEVQSRYYREEAEQDA